MSGDDLARKLSIAAANLRMFGDSVGANVVDDARRLIESTAARLAAAREIITEMEPRYRHDCNYCHGKEAACARVPSGGCLLMDERYKYFARAGTGDGT